MQKGKKEKEKEKSEKKSKKSIIKEPEPPEQNLLGDLVSLDTPTQSLQPTILGLETLQVCVWCELIVRVCMYVLHTLYYCYTSIFNPLTRICHYSGKKVKCTEIAYATIVAITTRN